MEREAKLKKQAQERVNVMIERAEIPIWTWEYFEIWRNEFEKQAHNHRATEEKNTVT